MIRFARVTAFAVFATASAAAMPPPVPWRSAATDAISGTYALEIAGRAACSVQLTNEAYGGTAPFNAYDVEPGSGCLAALGTLAGDPHDTWFWQLGPGGEIALLDSKGKPSLVFMPQSPNTLGYLATIGGKAVALRQTEPHVWE
jgi:hypothetical protein